MAGQQFPDPLRSVVILGGGTAGWMSAAYLNRLLNSDGPQVDVILIESPRLRTIGVGEGTVPSIRPTFFDALGIPEEEWMAASNASFKFGIKFVDWATGPGSERADAFYHTFGESLDVDGVPLTHYWVRKQLTGCAPPFAHACYSTASLCDATRAPKLLGGTAEVPYAYHFDAARLGEFLQNWAVERGVTHVADEIVEVRRDSTGDITSLRGKDGREYTADLYIDCSGFAATLIEGACNEPFMPSDGMLLCDRAVALRTPPDRSAPVRPYTTATAMDAGWTWQIDLPERCGNGYVYSSAFVDAEMAEADLRRFLGPAAADVPAKHLEWRVGRRRRAWVGNCISLGLSSGFLEPLEATAIYFVFAALHHLGRYLPSARMEPALRDKFNERIAFMYDDVRDFLVLHYCTTRREDTPFWRANRHELQLPDGLRALLAEYRAGAPVKLPYAGATAYNQLTFDASFDRFWTNSNYVAILAGMGVLPDAPMEILRYRPEAVREADRLFAHIAENTARLVRDLPAHGDYLAQLYGGDATPAGASPGPSAAAPPVARWPAMRPPTQTADPDPSR